MGLRWTDSLEGIDWEALSELYRVAPLGVKPAAGLKEAYGNSRYRWLVFDGPKLVGAGRALADGVDCSYVCDVAVHPSHQGLGLGREIVARLVEASRGHRKILLYAVPGKESFYAKFGFLPMATAMAIFDDPASAIERGYLKPALPKTQAPEARGTRALAAEWFETLWNRKDTSIIERLMDPAAAGVTETGAVRSLAEFKAVVVEPLFRTFPDLQAECHAIVVDGDDAIVRWTARGTHLGSLAGETPTGRGVEFSGMSWLRFRDGRMVEGGDSYNVSGLIQWLHGGPEGPTVRAWSPRAVPAPVAGVEATTPARGP